MLLRRVLVAAVFIPVLALLIFWGGVVFLCLMSAITGVALAEFYRGFGGKGKGVLPYMGVALGVLLPVSLYFGGVELLPLVMVLVILGLFLRQLSMLRVEGSSWSVFVTLGGILYVSFLLSHVILLREDPGLGMRAVFTVFFATWMGDSGAYFTGALVGKHKLLPGISPNKSVEGFVGGILASCVAVFISRYWFPLSFVHSVILGMLVGVTGQFGDFFESMLKREMKRKDSGAILPGHGGILDRFDSLLFTAPVFYHYLRYLVVGL